MDPRGNDEGFCTAEKTRVQAAVFQSKKIGEVYDPINTRPIHDRFCESNPPEYMTRVRWRVSIPLLLPGGNAISATTTAVKSTQPAATSGHAWLQNAHAWLQNAHAWLQNAHGWLQAAGAWVRALADAHPTSAFVFELYVGIFAVWLVLLLVAPTALLSIVGGFRSTVGKVTVKGVEILAIDRLFLLRPLAYQPYVLNRWVKKHAGHARITFDQLPVPAESSRFIAAPVSMDVDGQQDPVWAEPAEIAPLFQRNSALVIEGEGGAGKTSLACQIGRWVMQTEPELRVTKNVLLPVLIASDLDSKAPSKGTLLRDKITGQLQELIGTDKTIPDGLVQELLRRGLILVIVDGLSERSDATRSEVLRAMSGISRIVFTERFAAAPLTDRPVVRIRPLPIEGKSLFKFMDGFLSRQGEPWTFDEMLPTCERLSEIARDRSITALVATLYGRMVVEERAGRRMTDSPGSIPELMNKYVEDVIARTENDHAKRGEMKRALEALARACVWDSFVPREIKRSAALAAVGDNPMLTDCETRLRLVRSYKVTDHVAFVLDPLAEYLAAQHVVRDYADDEGKWRALLRRADALIAERDALQIRGFLVALRDCCADPVAMKIVPEFVSGELLRRSGSDLPTVVRQQIERRIGFFAAALESKNPNTRVKACEGLGRIGPVARSAAADLLQVLSDENRDVRLAGLEALSKIGVDSESVVVAVAGRLIDTDSAVRRKAAEILAQQAQPLLPALPALIAALESAADDGLGAICDALAKLGPEAANAQAVLEKLLAERPRQLDRVRIAKALWRVTQKPDAIFALVRDGLTSDDTFVRSRAGDLVEDLGGAFQQLAPTLLELCQHSNAETRASAARLLCRKAGSAPAVVSQLENLVKHETSPIARTWEAAALWRINRERGAQLETIISIMRSDPAGDARELAAQLLGQLDASERSVAALQDVIRADADGKVRVSAARALWKLKADKGIVVPALLECASPSSETAVRYCALEALNEEVRDESEATVLVNLEALRDKHVTIRRMAALTLRGIRPGGAHVIESLLQSCEKDTDGLVRHWAADALGEMGKAAEAAVPRLRNLLHDTDIRVRAAAAGALWQITRSAQDILRPLTEALCQEDQWLRYAVLESLKDMGPAAAPTVAVVSEMLTDLNSLVRQRALDVLAAIGRPASPATQAVMGRLMDEDSSVRCAALKALPQISTVSVSLVDTLRELLKDEQSLVRHAAAELIEELGPAASAAIPELVKLLSDSDWGVRSAAISALGAMGSAGLSAVGPLIEARLHRAPSDNDPSRSAEAELEALKLRSIDEKLAINLAQIAADSAAAIAVIAEYLAVSDESQVRTVIGILARVGPGAAATAPTLIELVEKFGGADVHAAIADALACMRVDTPEAIALLNRMLDPANSSQERSAAARALWKIRKDSSLILPLLQDALASPKLDFRLAGLKLAQDMGTEAKGFVPEIRRLMTTGEEREQIAAGLACWFIDQTIGIVDMLRQQIITSPDPVERISPVENLRKLGPVAHEALPEVKAAIKGGTIHSVEAFAAICENTTEKINVLMDTLGSSDQSLRAAAAVALGEMGPVAKKALEPLKDAAHDQDSSVRKAAAKAIRTINGDARRTPAR